MAKKRFDIKDYTGAKGIGSSTIRKASSDYDMEYVDERINRTNSNLNRHEQDANEIFKSILDEEDEELALETQIAENAQKEEEKLKYLPTDEEDEKVLEGVSEEDYKSFKLAKEKIASLEDKTYLGKLSNKFNELWNNGMTIEGEEDDNVVVSGLKKVFNAATAIPAGAAVAFTTFGNDLTSKEQIELDEAHDEKYRVQVPVKLNNIKKVDESLKVIEAEKEVLQKTKPEEYYGSNVNGEKTSFANAEARRIGKDKALLERAQTLLEHKRELDQDYVDNKKGVSSLFDGLGNQSEEYVSAGLISALDEAYYRKINDKRKKGEELSNAETLFRDSFDKLKTAKAEQSPEMSMYNTGTGIQSSVVMMEQTIATQAAMNAVLPGSGAGQLFANTTRAWKGLSALQKTVAVAKNIASVGIETAVQPTTFRLVDEKSNSSIKKVTDLNGNERYLSTDREKLGEYKSLNNLLKDKQSKLDNLQAKPELTKEDKLKMSQLQRQINLLNTNKFMLFDEDNLDSNLNKDLTDEAIKGRIRDKEVSDEDALIYGYTQNLKENASEVYVGEAAGKLFGGAKKLINKKFLPAIGDGVVWADKKALNIGASKFAKKSSEVASKIANSVDNLADNTYRKFSKGRQLLDTKFFESNKLGKISKAAVNHVGAAKVMHSIPEEMIEEIAVQATPSYTEDYSKQLESLYDFKHDAQGNEVKDYKDSQAFDFYARVAAQTAIMGAGFSTVGGANHYFNMATDADYKNQYQANKKDKDMLKKTYYNLDQATTDEQVAQDISMASMGTLFQINDYNGRVAELRNPKADHNDGLSPEERAKKAAIMERNSFYNLGIKAIETGTSSDFKGTLTRLSKNQKVSPETRANAVLGLSKFSALESIAEEHKNKLNGNKIIDLAIRDNLNKETLNDIEEKLRDIEPNVLEKIQEFNEDNGFLDNSFSILDFNNNSILGQKAQNEEEQGEFNKYLAQLKKESIPEVSQYLDLVLTKDLLTQENKDVNKELRFETNPANQEVIRRRELDKVTKSLVEEVNKDNVEDVKAELGEKELAEPEVIQQVNNKAIEDTNKAPNVLEAKTEAKPEIVIPTEEIKNSLSIDDLFGPETTLPNAVKTESEEVTVPEKLEETHNFSEGTLFSPIVFDESNEEHNNKVKGFEAGFKKLISNNPGLTFGGLIGNITRDAGEVRTSNNFDIMAKAWNNVSQEKISPKEQNDLYTRNFGSKDAASILFGNEVVVQASNPVVEAEVIKESLTPEVTKPNLVTTAPTQVYAGRKFATVGLKAGFLGLDYTENDDTKKVTISTDINKNALPFVDYRNFKVGDKVVLKFDFNYLMNPTNMVSKWYNVDEDPTKKSISVVQFLEESFPGKSYTELINTLNENPQELLSNIEFLKAMPIGIENNGLSNENVPVISGGLNDYYWFNVSNVAMLNDEDGNPMPGERRERVEANRKINLETRKQILSQGSITTTVTERRQGDSNTLLVPENSETGYSDLFQSLFTSFKGGTKEEAHENSAVGIVYEKSIVAKGKAGKEQAISVNGKEVTVDQIVNWEAFNSLTKDKEGSAQKTIGKMVMVVQSGVDADNRPLYVLHQIINNHESQQDRFRAIVEIKYKLNEYRKIVNGEIKNASAAQVEKAHKIVKNIKDTFKIDISLKENLDDILDMYPEEGTKDGKRTGNFRQDLKPKLAVTSLAKSVMDLNGFHSVADFESAALTNNLTSTTYNDIIYSNVHTQYIYTGVENKGKKVWTNEVQPVIVYSNEHLNNEVVENITKISQEQEQQIEQEVVKGQIEYKEKLLAEETDAEVKESIKEEIAELKKEVVELEKEVVVPVVEEEKEFFNTDVFQVVENIVFKGLSNIDITDKVTKSKVYEKINNAYKELVADLRSKGLNQEADFIEENREEILGESGYYENSMKEIVDAVFNLSEDVDLLDLTGENIKSYSKESYENSIADSLSLKVKILLSGITDTRKDVGGNFAGLRSTLSFTDALDSLQQIMSEIGNNTLEEVKKAIKNRQELNQEEFGFYNEIVERLDAINAIDNSVVNEILYSLYQPKVKMSFVLYNKNMDGSYSMEVYDANTKNPLFVKRAKWNENFKNSSIVTKFEEGFYKINEAEYNALKDLYSEIVNNGKKPEDIKRYFEAVGIKLNNKLYNILGDVNNPSHAKLYNLITSTTGVLKNIDANLKSAFESKKTLAFTKGVITDTNTQKTFNVLTYNNSQLNDLIHADNNVSFIPMNMMYIGGKMISVYEQPKRISNILKKLKSDAVFVQNLEESQISADNFLLNLMKEDPSIKDYLDVIMVSLEALKEKGTPSDDSMSITQLSNKDAFVTLFNLFASSEGVFESETLKRQGVKLRKGMMNFPTLSDSSQLPLLKSIVIDLQRQNVVNGNLSENITDILSNQLLKGDLKRIAAFLNSGQSTNIKGHDAGALFITGMSSLNSVAVDFTYKKNGEDVIVKRTLIEVFRNNPEYHTQEGIERFLTDYKEEITNEINRNVNYEVNKYINEDGTLGKFIENEIFKGNKLNYIDKEYLDRKGDVTGLEQARLIAYDYVVNTLIGQKEIQTTFAGDVANYFKDNMAKDLVNGNSVTTSQNIIDYYYKGQEAQIDALISSDDYETLFERFPKLRYSSEYISYDISHEEQYAEMIPMIQMKTKKMFEDVQNNLSKRLKELISPGNQFPNSRGNKIYKQIMVQDVENASEVLEDLVKIYHEDIYDDVVNDIRKFKALDDIYEANRTQEQVNEHKNLYKSLKEKLPRIEGFLKTASTDAQEYTSWLDNLNQLVEQGRITKDEYKDLKAKLNKQEQDLDKLGYITEDNKLTEKEMYLAIMQPTKPLYSGLHFQDINGYKLQRDIYIKSSSFPIVPELAAMFPKLNQLRKTIKKVQNGSENTVVRISYDSANKVGAVKNAIPMSELYKDDVSLDYLNSSVVDLDRENFYIQQDKPFKADKNALKGLVDTVTRATQFEKILLGDGISQITKHIFPNMFDAELIEELGIEVVDGKVNGPALKDLYNEIYKKEQKLFKEKLFRKLGIEDYKDIANGNVKSMEKLAEMLDQRLTNKQDKKGLELIYYVKDTIGSFTKRELVEKGLVPYRAEFKMPIFMSPNSRKFESVLNSVISKNSINLKLPGFSSPVASQEGFDYKGYEGQSSLEELKRQGLVTTKNFDPKKGLQATRNEDGSLKYAQVFLANKYKVFNSETGQYDYIDLKEYVDENGQIDTDKLPGELLSMFSFRIPTSSHQSGVIIEVAGFLPHSVGDLMIVPKDHTVQIGEDYDIDTRYVYQYNYIQKDGKLKKLETSDLETIEGNLEKVKAEYEGYKKELFDDYFNIKVDNNAPLKNSVFVNNTYWNSNRETLLEITFLQESLDNYNEDKVLHAVFQDEYDFAPIASREEMKDKIEYLKSTLIPKDLVKSKQNELKKEYAQIQKDLKDAYRNDKKGVKTAFYKYGLSLNDSNNIEKVLQNNLVSLYKTVFSSDNKEMQALINKTLSTDFAESTAQAMDKKINDSTDNIYNIFSPTTQSNIMALGADGKMGIGVHSNAVTMNSLLQQLGSETKSIKAYDEETGEPIFYDIKLGNLIFDGVLGKVSSNGFRISESGMESQNSATDNQKLQIMGRRNENAETISVFTILQATGLDNDGLLVDGKQEMSYASLFINQPILREYTELVKKYKSSTNSVNGSPEKMATKQLTDKYNKKVNPDKWITDDKGKPIAGKFKPEELEKLGNALNSQKLWDDLLVEEMDVASQLYVLKRFNELKEPAKEYNRLQKFVNIENGGLGISYFDTIELMEEMIDIARRDIKITNADLMVGDINMFDPKVDIKPYLDKGYILVKTTTEGDNILIKPDNHYSQKIVNSITDGYNLWSSLFPYESQFIDEQLQEIINISNVNNDNDRKELKYKAISELKDYIYSNSPELFNFNVSGKRQEIFFDDNKTKNVSLASYILELSNNPAFAYLFKLPLFKDFQYNINEGTYPSVLTYNNSDISQLNNINNYNTLNKLVNSTKKLLPRNGKDYTEADLMKEFLMYSLLSNQENGAIGFRQVLPIELFDKYGVTKNLRVRANPNNKLVQNVLYNGLTKSVESLFNNKISNSGVIENINKVPLEDVHNIVAVINNQLNGDAGVKEGETKTVYVKIIDDKGTVEFKDYSGNFQNSTFVRQFTQHNPEVTTSIKFEVTDQSEGYKPTKFQEFLAQNGIYSSSFDGKLDISDLTSFRLKPYTYGVIYKNEKVVNKRKVNSANELNDNEELLLENPKFLNIKDGNNVTRLYELKEENYYEQIPTLGTFGFNEYDAGRVINKSSVSKNNVKQFINSPIIPTDVKQLLTESNVSEIISSLYKDKNNPYRPLLEMIRPFIDVENIQVKVVTNLIGHGAYNPEDNTIYISQEFLDSQPTTKLLLDVVTEELLHSVTINAVNKYVDISEIDEKGKIQYTFKEGVTVPASLRTMLTVYQKAIDTVVKEQGIENLRATLDGFKNIKNGTSSQSSLSINNQDEMSAYRVMDIHEFIAGIFRKNTKFAQKMAVTPYLESGLSILQKYAETLTRLLYNILPSKRLDSISANMTLNLYDFLLEDSKNEVEKSKESAFNNSKNNEIMDSQKLIDSDEAEDKKDDDNEKKNFSPNIKIPTLKTKC